MFPKFISFFGSWKVIAIVVSLMVSFGGGYKIRDWMADAAHAKALAEQADLIEKMDAKNRELQEQFSATASNLEERLSQLRNQQPRTIVKWRQHAKNPDYKCPVPPDGVRQFNNTIANINKARNSR